MHKTQRLCSAASRDNPSVGYATVVDVLSRNPGRGTYTASSKPSDTQVVSYLEITAAEIDGILRSREYLVPVPSGTASSTLQLLKEGNILGAAAHVELTAQSSDRRDQAKAMWDDFRKMLETRELLLDSGEKDPDTAFGRFPASVPSPSFSVGMIDLHQV